MSNANASTDPWTIGPSVLAGPGLFARNWAVRYNGLTVMTFHSRADAEYWLAVQRSPRCRCSLPEQSCERCRAAAARNEANLKGGAYRQSE